MTPGEFKRALRDAADPSERASIERRLGPGDETIGIRMRDLFAVAKTATRMPVEQVEALFDDPLYEVRLGAICILDFRAKARGTTEKKRTELADVYLRRHDRITTWDMVDRAAPSVIGGHLLGGPADVLVELAGSEDPLRRRTAITAPLWFIRYGSDHDLTVVFEVASLLVAEQNPIVYNAVGIALKHAGARHPHLVAEFVSEHIDRLPRPVIRAAASKLPADMRRQLTE